MDDALNDDSFKRRLKMQNEVLKWLEDFSERLQKRANDVTVDVHGLLAQAGAVEKDLKNTFNSFRSLSNLQFIENRIYDEDETTIDMKRDMKKSAEVIIPAQSYEADILPRYKEALSLGLSSCRHHFQKTNRTSSTGSIFRIGSTHGQLPHIIGSEEYIHDNSCGLTEELIQERTALNFSHEAERKGVPSDASVSSSSAIFNADLFGVEQNCAEKDGIDPLVSAARDFKAMLEAALLSPYKFYDEEGSSVPSVGGGYNDGFKHMHAKLDHETCTTSNSVAVASSEHLASAEKSNVPITKGTFTSFQDSDISIRELCSGLMSGNLFDADEETYPSSQNLSVSVPASAEAEPSTSKHAAVFDNNNFLKDAYTNVREGSDNSQYAEQKFNVNIEAEHMPGNGFSTHMAVDDLHPENRKGNKLPGMSAAPSLFIQEGRDVHSVKSYMGSHADTNSVPGVTMKEPSCVGPRNVSDAFEQEFTPQTPQSSSLNGLDDTGAGKEICRSDQLIAQVFEKGKGLFDDSDSDVDDIGHSESFSDFKQQFTLQKQTIAEISDIGSSTTTNEPSPPITSRQILHDRPASNGANKVAGELVGEAEPLLSTSSSHSASVSMITYLQHKEKPSLSAETFMAFKTARPVINNIQRGEEPVFSTLVSVSREPQGLFSPAPFSNHDLPVWSSSSDEEGDCSSSPEEKTFPQESCNTELPSRQPEALSPECSPKCENAEAFSMKLRDSSKSDSLLSGSFGSAPECSTIKDKTNDTTNEETSLDIDKNLEFHTCLDEKRVDSLLNDQLAAGDMHCSTASQLQQQGDQGQRRYCWRDLGENFSMAYDFTHFRCQNMPQPTRLQHSYFHQGNVPISEAYGVSSSLRTISYVVEDNKNDPIANILPSVGERSSVIASFLKFPIRRPSLFDSDDE